MITREFSMTGCSHSSQGTRGDRQDIVWPWQTRPYKSLDASGVGVKDIPGRYRSGTDKLIRRCLIEFAPPRELNRWVARGSNREVFHETSPYAACGSVHPLGLPKLLCSNEHQERVCQTENR